MLKSLIKYLCRLILKECCQKIYSFYLHYEIEYSECKEL